MKKVIIVVGPTGSGKTALSLEIAKAFGGEIINGDSVQVYKGLDIGSAKIKQNEMQGITHHLLDIRDPKDTYSVYDFQKDVRKLIETISCPIIVGGTGFYMNAAISNYEFVEDKRHDQFDASYAHLSDLELYEILLKLDPQIKIDVNNRRRVLRALEQALQGNLRSSKVKKDERLYDAFILYLDLDRTTLEKRLILRLEKQLKEGFVDEVKRLKDNGLMINAIGYKEIYHYLLGEIDENEMKDQIIKASKRLAKKQKTYFINQMHPFICDALSETLVDDVKSQIQRFLEEKHEKH